MTEHGDEQLVRVARVHEDVGNLLAVAQAEVGSRLPRVGRLVNPVADGEIGSRQPFIAADAQWL